MLAHEMRQPLIATANYLQGARRLLDVEASPAKAKIGEALGKAGTQVDRAVQIEGRLRRPVDKGKTERLPEDVAATFDEAEALIELGGIDRVQIQRVLINLVRNALEAMRHNSRREIVVFAQRVEGMIELAVADNGPGLPKEVADRLLQPFITTEPEGMGSACQSAGLSSRPMAGASGRRPTLPEAPCSASPSLVQASRKSTLYGRKIATAGHRGAKGQMPEYGIMRMCALRRGRVD